ncbi:MAG: poly(beta-D-mannuronate) O-acetylase [Myxococcota bacterium]
MLFNSVEFWLFFAVVSAVALSLPARFRLWWLLAASCTFYMRWNASYIVLVAFSAVVDYTAGLLLTRPGATPLQRRAVLAVSLLTNLGLLFTFKYWAFFHDSVAVVAGWFGWVYHPRLSLLLPVGISFYTFQTMSYTIDLYRGTLPRPTALRGVRAVRHVLPARGRPHRARAGRLLEQLQRPEPTDAARITSGLQLAAWGRRRSSWPTGCRCTPTSSTRTSTPTTPPRSSSRPTPSPSRSTPTSPGTPTSPSAPPACWASI